MANSDSTAKQRAYIASKKYRENNLEKTRAAVRQYRSRNREATRVKARADYAIDSTKSRSASLAWYYRNKDKARERNKQWTAANKEKINARATARRRSNIEKYRAKERMEAGLPEPTRPCPDFCESCGGPPNGQHKVLALDHCHVTGAFRGWLCNTCNIAFGMLGDNHIGVEKLLRYALRGV